MPGSGDVLSPELRRPIRKIFTDTMISNDMERYAVGADIGGSHICSAVVDLTTGEICGEPLSGKVDCDAGAGEILAIHELGEELSGVTLADNGDVEIGPLTTFRGVTFSDVIRRTIPVLGEAADMAGGPQLRAAGTIGGNVCNGITSADTASTLVALDAVLRVRGPKGEREVPISQWYQGVGKVALAPYELLVKIVIPYDNYVGYTGHYIKYAQRNAMDIATLGVSCLVKLTSDKKMVDDAALAFGVAGPVPMRSPAAEAAVRGLPIGEAIAAIGEAALADVNPRTSWRASKEFRIQLVKELSARALREAARKGGADV